MLKNAPLFIVMLCIVSCSSSEPIVQTPTTNTSSEVIDSNPSDDTSTEDIVEESYLDQYRSSLSDTYSNRINDIPEEYAQIKVEEDSNEETDMFEGYRVQIYSGQNVALADTIASIFRAWSDTTIVGYQADTYTFFKAPYYRVHVGDFHERDRAIYFSNLLKRRFRDAWVVYDRIDPWNIPADTTDIYTK